MHAQHGEHACDEVGVFKLPARHVQCDEWAIDVGHVAESLQRLTHFAQHVFADRHDQRGLLGERDEVDRRYDAAFRIGPARQRFEAGDARLGDIEDRLQADFELAAFERVSQLAFEANLVERMR